MVPFSSSFLLVAHSCFSNRSTLCMMPRGGVGHIGWRHSGKRCSIRRPGTPLLFLLLVGVVRETMQPVHISLWLCPYQEARGGRGEDPRSHDSHQQAASDPTKSARRGGSTSTSSTEGRRSRW